MTQSILPPDDDKETDEKAEMDAVFVQEYVKCGDAVIACLRAGIRDPRYTIDVVAERQLNKPVIRDLIAIVEKIDVDKTPVEITRERLNADMEVVKEQALRDRQYGSVIAAAKLQAALNGLISQTINIHHRVSAEMMTDADLLRIAEGGDRKPVIDADYSEIDDDRNR